MQNRLRCFPPAVPVRFTKLLEYESLSKIYKKYDSNFFREILQYFCEMVTTSSLEIHKFVYIPLDNPNKVAELSVGSIFQPTPQMEYQLSEKSEWQIANSSQKPLTHPSKAKGHEKPPEVTCPTTFIKINYHIHKIFEFVLPLNLFRCELGMPSKIGIQEKFWLLAESVLRVYKFNEKVFAPSASVSSMAVYLILEGEFKCFDSSKKMFRVISKGSVVGLDGKIHRLESVSPEESAKSSHSSTHSTNTSKHTTPKSVSQTESDLCGQNSALVAELRSNSNAPKLLVIDPNLIKKYLLKEEDIIYFNRLLKSINDAKQRSQITICKNKYKKICTEGLENRKRQTYGSFQNQHIQENCNFKKFNLISCREGTNEASSKNSQDLLERIRKNSILKSYTKDTEIYQKFKEKSTENRRQRIPPLNKQNLRSSVDREKSFDLKVQSRKLKTQAIESVSFQNSALREIPKMPFETKPHKVPLKTQSNLSSDSFKKAQLKKIGEKDKFRDTLQQLQNEQRRVLGSKYVSEKRPKLTKVVHKASSSSELLSIQLLKRNLMNMNFHQKGTNQSRRV